MAQREQIQRVNDNCNGSLSLESVRDRLREFAAARDWNQFHSPKNLTIALSVEAGELLEQFQWLTDQESAALADDKREKIEAEMADVLLYLIRLADVLDVDLLTAANAKIDENEKKYPVEKSRGSAKKYTEL